MMARLVQLFLNHHHPEPLAQGRILSYILQILALPSEREAED